MVGKDEGAVSPNTHIRYITYTCVTIKGPYIHRDEIVYHMVNIKHLNHLTCLFTRVDHNSI